MDLPERARQMVVRVRAAAGRSYVDTWAALVAAAVELAIAERSPTMPEHDPALLHPGRSVLVMLEDAREREPVTAAAAALVESVDTGVAVESERIRAALGERVASARDLVPTPEASGDVLLESLLAADQGTRRIAVAERLDHARHLHLRGSEVWREFFENARDVYLPVAGRTDPVLARRFEWWTGMFERRYMARI